MKKKHLYFSGQSKVLYNEEENLIFVLSNSLIAREPDVRRAFCAADADPGVRGQGWSSDPGSPPGEGVPSSDLIPCQGQMTTVRLCWLWSQPGGNQRGESCQSSGTAIESSRLRLFFLPLSPQVDVDKAWDPSSISVETSFGEDWLIIVQGGEMVSQERQRCCWRRKIQRIFFPECCASYTERKERLHQSPSY